LAIVLVCLSAYAAFTAGTATQVIGVPMKLATAVPDVLLDKFTPASELPFGFSKVEQPLEGQVVRPQQEFLAI